MSSKSIEGKSTKLWRLSFLAVCRSWPNTPGKRDTSRGISIEIVMQHTAGVLRHTAGVLRHTHVHGGICVVVLACATLLSIMLEDRSVLRPGIAADRLFL
jgi:hypothetical protein